MVRTSQGQGQRWQHWVEGLEEEEAEIAEVVDKDVNRRVHTCRPPNVRLFRAEIKKMSTLPNIRDLLFKAKTLG